MENETWAEMSARHRREKNEAAFGLSLGGASMGDAAEILGMTYHELHAYCRRHGIEWMNVRPFVR